ncbi:MAG: MmgE/PrpD family protein [Gaiellales bacterium]
MSAKTVAEQVDSFARELRLTDVPAHVRRQLALLLLDHIAVSEAGRLAPASRIAADHASEVYGGDAATSLFDGRRLSVPGAAFANGVQANALDYDDGHRLTKGHPGAIVIPAVLAVAESVDATVEQLLEAIVVGYEVAIRAGVLIHEREAQYHASASWGGLGVAVAAGRLLGLDRAALRHAVGIAEYHAPIALMPRAVGDPAMTKDTCGWGGVIGTTSALLAARGFTGLDSEFMQADEPLELGTRWECLELYLKPYPCCRWSQPAVDAALALRAQLDDPGEISSIVVHTFAEADLLSQRRPENTEEMQYSLVWPVATALVRGRFGVDEALGGFDDELVARLVARTRIEIDPAFSAAFPARRLTGVELGLDDGRTLRSGAVEAGGEPGSPGFEEVVLGKVRRQLLPEATSLALVPAPPTGTVGGRSRDELVALCCYALAGR